MVALSVQRVSVQGVYIGGGGGICPMWASVQGVSVQGVSIQGVYFLGVRVGGGGGGVNVQGGGGYGLCPRTPIVMLSWLAEG